jgi:repressor LexA
MEELTKRQQQMLEAIYSFVRKRGLPPTVRELGQRVGLRSTCTVQRHLEALIRKGVLKRDGSKARSIEIIASRDPVMIPRRSTPVPVVGAVAAGQPITAVENIEQVIPLPSEFVPEDAFLLRLKGDSMIEAGLLDGDYVVVRPQKTAEDGEIVVALIDDEATVKRFRRKRGKIHLEPANSTMAPIVVNDADILGTVVMSLRRY